MTGIHLPLFDEIAEQVAVVVDTARAEELAKWVDWLQLKRDKAHADADDAKRPEATRAAAAARAVAFETARAEIALARGEILDALKGEK